MTNELTMWADLQNKALEVEAAWLRHILTLAAGALAVLAGLEPTVPETGPARHLLAATWACLGLGIVTGGAATFLEVDRARRLVKACEMHIARAMTDGTSLGVVRGTSSWGLESCKWAMVCTLGTAAVCLAAYATIMTLNS